MGELQVHKSSSQLFLQMKNYTLFFLLFILSFIIPKKKNLIVCGGGDAKHFQGNPKYILLYLLKYKNHHLEVYWSSKTKQQQDQLDSLNLPYIDPYSWVGFFTLLRANYIFIEKSSFDAYYIRSVFGRFNFIQTWHGTPIKKIGIDTEGQNTSLPLLSRQNSLFYKFLKGICFFSRQKFKLITAPSEITAKLFKRAFENKNVAVTGYPRNDIFFDHNLSIRDFEEELNLKSFDRVVLYAPTFRDNTQQTSPFTNPLNHYNNTLKDKNYLLLVKKHPWQKNLTIQKGLSHIKDVSIFVCDIQELLIHTDILITDFSSCFFDFMLSGKPIIYYSYDFESYIKQCRSLYIDYYKDLPGPFAKDEKELFDLVFSVEEWKNKILYKNQYKKVLDGYNTYQDGHSTKRLLEKLFPLQNFDRV